MITILVVAAITLFGSFCCSLFEATLYALTPSRLELMRRKGAAGAELLTKLRANIDEPIAAILTINTITHTAGSAACGALVANHFGSGAVGIFAALFTFAVLFFTEIIPKSLGVKRAAQLGPLIARPLQLMIWSVWPIVKSSAWLMKKLSGGHGDEAPSEDEVVVTAGLAARGGELRAEEHRWLKGALHLDRATAGELATPRTVVQTRPREFRLDQVDSNDPCWLHSRIPLTEGDKLDQICGLVYRREIFAALIEGPGERRLADFLHPLEMVEESTPGHELLNLFIETHKHIVGVRDEYGGFVGIVSLEDVLEFLLGTEIVDEHDQVEDMQAHARELAAKSTDPPPSSGSSGAG